MHGTLPATDELALATLRDRAPTRVDTAALAKEWHWTREKVRRRVAKWRRDGELPDGQRRATKRDVVAAEIAIAPPIVEVAPVADVAPDTTVAAATAPAAAPPRRPLGRLVGAGILAAVGVGLAAVGATETVGYAWAVGGLVFAALALCADALVLFMPSAVAALWRKRTVAAILGAALWVVGSAVTLANLSGYVGGHDDGFRAGRENQSTERELILERLGRLRHERAAIREDRPVGALTAALPNAPRWQRPILREAVAVAQRRDAVDAELLALESRLPAVPQIALADPSASVLSAITGARISEHDLRRLRLALMLLLPLCGGFVLSVGLSLIPAGSRD